jgi:hypothetical protein
MSPEQKAQYFAVSFVNALKQLTTKKRAKTIKNKQSKHGSSYVKWSKLQKKYYKLFGDLDGPSVKMEHAPSTQLQPQQDDSDSEQSSYHTDFETSSEAELSFSDFESNSEREDEEEEAQADEEQPEKHDKADQQGGHDGNEEKAKEAPHKMAQGRQQVSPGAMLHMSPGQLPVIQGLRRDEQKGYAVEPKTPHRPSSPPLHMSKAGFVPSRTLAYSPNIVPPPVVHSPATGHTKDTVDSHGHSSSRKSTQDPKVLQMGSSTTKKDDPLRSPTFRRAVPKAGPSAKPTIALKRLTSPISTVDRRSKEKPNNIELLAQIVGLSPGSLSKKAKQELVGQLLHEAHSDAMPALARPSSVPEPASSKQQPHHPRSKTPALDKREQQRKEAIQGVAQAQSLLKTEEELAQQGLIRPTRSTSRGPPIAPLPKLPLEYRKKMTPAERHKMEWLESEKKLAEERRKEEERRKSDKH